MSHHAPQPCLLEQREDLQIVLRAIERLSDVCRDIVVMRFIEGRSYDEISTAVGKSVHQTRALCFKSIVRLRMLTNTTHAQPQKALR